MKSLPKLLSKSKIMRGYQCAKSLYFSVHHKDFESPVSPDQQAVFDQGHEVGAKAREYFPNGVLVDNKPWDFFGSLKKTRELLSQQTEVIYEAAFEYKSCYARVDILVFNRHSNRWNIYEVKSGTKLKDEYLDDISLQAWIIAHSGLPIETINLMYINSSCRYPDLSNLFITEDVTQKVREQYTSIGTRLTGLFKTLQEDSIPAIDIGPHCSSPNPCSFKDHCWSEKNIPEVSVFNLPKISTEAKWQLYKENILKLDDVRLTQSENLNPPIELSELQKRMIDCYKNNYRFVDYLKIKEILKDWKFPLVFLDFETINPAIPRYLGTAPYQQVPFQYSIHVWESPNSSLKHYEYLHTDESDPRIDLIPKLIEACRPAFFNPEQFGTVVCYYSQFESSRIKELIDFVKLTHSSEHIFPKNIEADLQKINELIKDPLPLIREFIYDNQFQGSFSLKKVGPALLGNDFSYDHLNITDGSAAQRAFLEIQDPLVSPSKKEELIQSSLDYCRQDTLILVQLLKFLFEI